MQRFTTANPEVELEVLDRLELSPQRVLFQVRVTSEEPKSWTEEFRKLPDVREVELIDAADRSGIYRILFAGRTFVPTEKRLKLLRQFPFPILGGVATWTVLGPGGKLRALIQRLRATGVRIEVDAIHHAPVRGESQALTARQREILRRAIAAGYFEVPRRVTLTDLAGQIGVATSTLSVSLAIIERKIVDSHAVSGGALVRAAGEPEGR